MNKKLSLKQRIIADGIKTYFNRYVKMPTLKELREFVNVNNNWNLQSDNSILQYLRSLEKKGIVEMLNKKRGIRLIQDSFDQFIDIPVFGMTSAGEAICYADDLLNNITDDYISISKSYIQKGDKKNYFLIKVAGDSMTKKDINDGDYLLIQRTNIKPNNGDIVLATINGLATIKIFKKDDRENSPWILMPASYNGKHKPIILKPEDNLVVCGILKANLGNIE